MRVTRIHHIAIAVRNIEEMLKIYEGQLGLKLDHIEIQEQDKARTAIIPVGDGNIELVEATSPDSLLAKFIEKRAEGIHHFALEVTDIEDALETLEDRGATLIDKTLRKGVEHTRIGFLHPKGTKALVEIIETEKTH